MLKYICKRLLLMIPVILGISLLVFALLDLSPGDAAEIILGTRATPEALANLRAEMGLDQPFWVRYLTYIGNAIQGNFGTSWRTKLTVINEITARLPQTLTLAMGAMFLTVLIGLPIGVISAVKQYSALDNVTQVGALVLSSVPGFWLGTLLILFFSLQLGLLPATGASSFKGYILPWVTLAASSIASLVRMTRSSMLEVIGADYIKMARAKGCTEKQVIMRHSLRNALLPIVTVIGMHFAGLIGGTVIIENVFTIPGLGSLAVTSLRQLDVPMVMAEVLFIALAVGVTNLIVDVIYVYIDPRLKSQYVCAKARKGVHAA
ncbi:MAG: ABC transporter permease [Candidatus Limiplasma sp.]|nr:ABC transporter permease [Candidatus Limiplasma sp.]